MKRKRAPASAVSKNSTDDCRARAHAYRQAGPRRGRLGFQIKAAYPPSPPCEPQRNRTAGWADRSFNLESKVGRDSALGGRHARARARQSLHAALATREQPGALLGLTDFYPRMHGGQMWIAMDPPAQDQPMQSGTRHHDFRECGMNRRCSVCSPTRRTLPAPASISRNCTPRYGGAGRMSIASAVVPRSGHRHHRRRTDRLRAQRHACARHVR